MTPERVGGLPLYLAWPLRVMAGIAWLIYLFFFSVYLASAEWVMIAAMAGLVLCICFVVYDLRLIAVIWFAGSPTVFVFANNILDALPFATVERVIFFGLTAIMICLLALRKRNPLPLDTIEKLIFAFLALAALGMARHLYMRPQYEWKSEVAFYLQGYFMPMLSYWLMRRLNWTDAWVVRYLFAVACISVILAFQGVSQIYLGMGLFVPTWVDVINEGRATGAFSNATEFGVACLISMLFCLLLQSYVKDKALWVLLLVLAVFAAFGLFLCKTRAPWLAAVICMMIVFVHDRHQRPMIATAVGLGICAIFVALPFIVESELFKYRLTDIRPIYARISLYASGVLILLDHPILGIGMGRNAFQAVKGDYLISFMGISYDEGQRTGPPHNEWLGIMTMTGLVGISLYIAIHVKILSRLKEIRRDATLTPFQRLMAAYVTAIFVSQIVISMFVDTGYLLYTTSATFGAVGIVSSRWQRTSDWMQDCCQFGPASKEKH